MIEVELSGSVLVSGGLNVGKTRLTAEAIRRYAARHDTTDRRVVLLDFAPELVRDGSLVGGRVSRFVDLPDDVSEHVLEANAPRLEGDTEEETVQLARHNYERGIRLIESAPDDPDAVFVNDATIPFQHPDSDPDLLSRYCLKAEDSLVNVYDAEADSEVSDGESGTDTLASSSSRTRTLDLHERKSVEAFRDSSETEIRL